MRKSKKKKLKLMAMLAFAVSAIFASVTVFAAGTDDSYDQNGWYVGADKVHAYDGLTDDGFSRVGMNHSGATINSAAIDLTKGEFSFAMRLTPNSSSVATCLNVLTAAEADGWKAMTEKTAVRFRTEILDNSMKPSAGFPAGTSDWSSDTTTTHVVSIYVGTGLADDLSYVAFDGVKKTADVTRNNFARVENGETVYTAYVGFYAPYARKIEISGLSAPIITAFDSQRFDIRNGSEKDLTISYKNAADSDFSVYTYQYGGEKYVFEKDVDYTVSASGTEGRIVIKKEAFPKVNWLSNNAKIYIENKSGISAKKITVISGDAPVWKEGTALETEIAPDEIQDGIVREFVYSDSDVPALEIGQAPAAYTEKGRDEVTDGANFEKTADGYKLKISGDYLAALEKGIYYFTVKTKNGDIEFAVYLAPETVGWVVRESKGEIVTDVSGNYLTLDMNGWVGDISKDGRAFYSQGFDVSEPLFVEYTDYNAGGWIMFNIDDDPYGFEYVMENNITTPSKVKLLDMIPNENEQRRFGAAAGFVTSTTVGFGAYLNENNADVMEIYVGENRKDSYIKINGHDITESFQVSLKRDQFKTGKMWLSIFTAKDTAFTVNAKVNAPVAYYPDGEPVYVLKSNDNVSVKLSNVKGNLSVSRAGQPLSSSDYEYGADGTLLLKSSYLKTLPFASQYTFAVSADNGVTEFNVKTEISGAGGNVALKNGETTVKYYTGSDVIFNFDMAGEQFTGLVDAGTEENVNVADYEFSGDKLVLKSSAFANAKEGVYSYLFTTEASLVKIYVVNVRFNSEGYNDILHTAEISGRLQSGITVKGGGDVWFNAKADLAGGETYYLTMKNVLGYYNTGSAGGASDSYVDLRFRDVEAGLVVIARIRPNGAADNSSIRSKLWAELIIEDALGVQIAKKTASFRLSVFDETSVKIEKSGDELLLYVADESAIVLPVGEIAFSGNEMIFSAYTAAERDDKFMEYLLKTSENDPDESPAGDSEESSLPASDDGGKKKGCGGAVNAIPVALCSAIALAAVAIMNKKSKKIGE